MERFCSYIDWTNFTLHVVQVGRKLYNSSIKSCDRRLNSYSDFTQISCRNGPDREKEDASTMKKLNNRQKSRNYSPAGTKCGSVCEQLFAPYVAIQEVTDRLSFSVSFLIAILLTLFFDEQEIVTHEFSSFTRNYRWLYTVNRVIQLSLYNHLEQDFDTHRTCLKKGVDDRYRYVQNNISQNSCYFLFPSFFSFCNRFDEP